MVKPISNCHLSFNGFRDVYGRLSWDKPANTLTSGYTNPSKGRFVHPEQNRYLTPREAAALQGFPDNFIFEGTNW
jgi:DNA (cytosine-5)-methyltransferase 1